MKRIFVLISVVVIIGSYLNVNAQTTTSMSTTTSILMDCQLTISISPPEGGTTSPPPPTYFIMSCQPFDIEAFPNPGYTFSHWEGDFQGSDNPIMLSGWNGLITAVFTLESTSIPNFCKGLADFDNDVDGSDAGMFKSHFGRSVFENPCPPDGPAPVAKTGQTTSYATGDDGDLEKGVSWPIPRFTDNGDGTVTDNLTGLIWLKDANCFGIRAWDLALSDSNGLSDGSCELTDGSSAGDWRLPNKKELISLTHDGYFAPALSNTAGIGQWSEGDPFYNVQNSFYWSCTTYAYYYGYAWYVNMYNGNVDSYDKYNYNHVWPVRGGH